MNNNNNRGSNRRRGRGNNNRQQGGNQGNRIDSRARGNAPQMLEKYRKLAHDASLNGDRVQAEYYLQFADHYFRVIADSRVGKDDQRPQQQGNRDQSYDDEFRDEDDPYHRVPQNNGRDNGPENGRDAGRDGGRDGNRDANRDANRDGGRRDRPNDGRREQGESDRDEGETSVEGDDFEPTENPFTRDNRDNRESRGRRPDGDRPERAPRPERAERGGRSRRPAANEAASDNAAEGNREDEGPRFDPALLPPSFATADAEPRTEERKPARKPRKPRAASSTEGRDEKGGEELETVN